MNFTWKILELFADAKGVKYHLIGTDGKNTVETEGNHEFSEGLVSKSFSEIKEADLIVWLVTDTTKNDINEIKLNVENQLKKLENNKKVDFPWLDGTFTI
jgi:hypothetical protein